MDSSGLPLVAGPTFISPPHIQNGAPAPQFIPTIGVPYPKKPKKPPVMSRKRRKQLEREEINRRGGRVPDKPAKYNDLTYDDWIKCHESIAYQMLLPENKKLHYKDARIMRRSLKRTFVEQCRAFKIRESGNEKESSPRSIQPSGGVSPSRIVPSKFLERNSDPVDLKPSSSGSYSRRTHDSSVVNYYDKPSSSSAFPPVQTDYYNPKMPVQQFAETSNANYEPLGERGGGISNYGYNYLPEKWWEKQAPKIDDRDVAASIVNGLTGSMGNDVQYGNASGYCDLPQQSFPMSSTSYFDQNPGKSAEILALEKRLYEIERDLVLIDKKEKESSLQVEELESDWNRRDHELRDRERQLDRLERNLKRSQRRSRTRSRSRERTRHRDKERNSGSRYGRRSRSRSSEDVGRGKKRMRREEIKILKREQQMEEAKQRNGIISSRRERVLKINGVLPRHRMEDGKHIVVYNVSDDECSSSNTPKSGPPLPFNRTKKDNKYCSRMTDISDDEDVVQRINYETKGDYNNPIELDGISDED